MEYALPIKCTESNHQEASILYLSLEILTIFFGTLRLLQTAANSGIPEILAFRETVASHMDGILNHARFAIDSGRVEGTNNMIKTIRRKAYGYTDTEYFFLRIMFESRKPLLVYRSQKPHKFLN